MRAAVEQLVRHAENGNQVKGMGSGNSGLVRRSRSEIHAEPAADFPTIGSRRRALTELFSPVVHPEKIRPGGLHDADSQRRDKPRKKAGEISTQRDTFFSRLQFAAEK